MGDDKKIPLELNFHPKVRLDLVTRDMYVEMLERIDGLPLAPG